MADRRLWWAIAGFMLLFVMLSIYRPLDKGLVVIADIGKAEHQLTYHFTVHAPECSQSAHGCPFKSPGGDVMASGRYLMSFSSVISGTAACREDGVELPCPKSITLSSPGKQITLEPNGYAQLSPNINVTYYLTYGLTELPIRDAKGGQVKHVEYMDSASVTLLIGFEVDNMMRIDDDPENVLVVPFRGSSEQSYMVTALTTEPVGMDGLMVGQEVSDVMQFGSVPILQNLGEFKAVNPYAIPTYNQELGTRQQDVFPAVSIDVFGDSPYHVNLQTYDGRRHIYDVLPVGADTSQTRARSSRIRVIEGDYRNIIEEGFILPGGQSVQGSSAASDDTVGDALTKGITSSNAVIAVLLIIGLTWFMYRR